MRVFIVFCLFLALSNRNLLADSNGNRQLIMDEIKKSIQYDYDLKEETKTISFVDDSDNEKGEQKKELTRGERVVEEQKAKVRQKLSKMRGDDGTSKLSGKEKIEMLLKKNREKIKAMKDKEKTSSSSSSSLSMDKVKEWENSSLKKVSRWEEEKKATLKKWEEDKKRFLKMIPVYQKNLVNIEEDYKESVEATPQKKLVAKPPKILTKKVVMDLFDDIHLVKNAFSSEVKDQGRRPTCAAFAGTRALEIVLAQKGKTMSLSEQYFYWLSKPRCQSSPCPKGGSWALTGYQISQRSPTLDIPSESECEYNGQAVSGNTTQIPLASSCGRGVAQVKSFYQLKTMDQVLNAIKNNYPVVGGFKLSKNFYRNNGYVFLSDKSAKGQLDSHAAGHAILLIGHMKLPKELHAREGQYCLIAANSWGVGWGKGGHACLSEKWLKKYRFNVPFLAVTDVKSI